MARSLAGERERIAGARIARRNGVVVRAETHESGCVYAGSDDEFGFRQRGWKLEKTLLLFD